MNSSGKEDKGEKEGTKGLAYSSMRLKKSQKGWLKRKDLM
jgi:hypothetical protein